MKILESMKTLVRRSTIAMVATVAMTSTTMVATHDAYAFPNLSFGRIAELTHFQTLDRLGLGLSIGGVPVGLLCAATLAVAAFPEAAVAAATVGLAVSIGGLATMFVAHHEVGRIDGNDRWFLQLNDRQRHRFFPDYYDPGASVSRNADTRGARGDSTSGSGGRVTGNVGFHH